MNSRRSEKRPSVLCLAAIALALTVGSRATAQSCVGDCNGDLTLRISELVTGVNIALGKTDLSECTAFDFDGDGRATISELTRAVNNAIRGCQDAVQIMGGCDRPGPGPKGLVPCAAGTGVAAYVCLDSATCLGDTNLPLAGETVVETQGEWLMLINAADAAADLLFSANIDGATSYRVIDFSTVGERGRLLAGLPPARQIRIGPASEAAVRLLELNGLEHFTADEIAAVQAAVDDATDLIDFSVLAGSGYSAADAADLATLTALRDPAVADALEDGLFGTGTLPTRTPTAAAALTPTATPTPTATSTPLQRFVFVTNLGSDSVSVIDTNDDVVIDTVPVGVRPLGIATTSDRRLALVVNDGPAGPGGAKDRETVSIIDTATRRVVATVPDFNPSVFTRPFVVAVGPDDTFAYVTHNASATVEVLDLRRALSAPASARVAVIPVEAAPLGIALARSRPFAFVASVEAQILSVVDTNARQVVRTVPLGAKPAFVALTHDDALAYVSDQLVGNTGTTSVPDRNVAVVDTQRALDSPETAVIDTIQVGLQPTGLAISSDDRLVHVVNAASASLSIIDRESREVTTVPLLGGSLPQTVAATDDGTRLYVADCGLDAVSVVDVTLARSDPLNAVIKTIPVGVCPQGIAVAEPR